MRIKGCALFVIWMVMCVSPAYPQVTTGTISGTVKDATGAVLPGAELVILNEDTGVSRTVVSDEKGYYSAPLLSLGNYKVTASLPGFQTESRVGIELTLGRDAVVDMQLKVGSVNETVEVTGEAPLVQTHDATVGYLVQDTTIRDLPLNGRDLQQVILLNPSVAQAEYAGTGSAYAGWGMKISISGLRTEDNSFLLDGSFIADFSRHAPVGPSGALLGSETVREFQVLTNSFSAQYGRVLGGVFNAVSKSGTNDLHGDVYEFLRNDALDANLWENNRSGAGKPPFRRNQFGATVGGPLVRSKTFFFANYEGYRQSLTSVIATPVPDANARKGILSFLSAPVTVSPKIQSFLDAIPMPSPQGHVVPSAGTQEFIWNGTSTNNENFFQGRLDHNFSSSDTFFTRATISNAFSRSPLALPAFGQQGILKSRLVTLAETHVFSPRVLNTQTFSFNRVNPSDKGSYPPATPGVVSVPESHLPADVGYGFSGYTKPTDQWTTNRFNERDDVNITFGKHAVQFGGMLERMQFNMNQPSRPYGQWTFADIQAFLAATPRQYRGTPPSVGNTVYNSIRGLRQWFGALYAEDTWQVIPQFTFSVGVRWEPYSSPTEVNNLLANIRNPRDSAATTGGPLFKNKSWGDIGPRLGFAWSPFKNGKTSIRGGAGIFYVPNDPTVYFIQATRTDPYFPDLAFNPIDPSFFPDGIATILHASTVAGAPEAIEFENFRSPSSYQYNLNIQQQFGPSTVLSVGYIGNRGKHVTTYGDYNAPYAFFDGVSLAVPSTAKRFNPRYGAMNYYTNGGRSWYDGLAVSLQRRVGAFRGQLSYTYSKALSYEDAYSKVDRSGSSSSLVYAYDLKYSKGLSGYHLGQKLSFSYAYDLPVGKGRTGAIGRLITGWQTSGIVTRQSGQPFDVVNASGGTAAALSGLGYASKPNMNPTFHGKIIEDNPDEYFNPAAFIAASTFQLGNVGRNTLIGPGYFRWDSGLNKTLSVTERVKMQFRAELFDVLNHPNFGKPNTSVFTSNGLVLKGQTGRITSTVGSARQVQFGLKLMF